MSDLEKMGFAAFGQGILHPNLRYRFVVQFLGQNNEQLSYSHKLSQQVINVSGIIEHREGNEGNTLITFQDDCTNAAIKGLLSLQQEEDLTIAIHQLDGAGSVLRTTYLRGARLESFLHSNLDYAGSTDESAVNMDIHFPSHVGNAIEELKTNPAAAAILTALSGAQVRVNATPRNRTSAANEISAHITFEDTSYDFTNRPISG